MKSLIIALSSILLFSFTASKMTEYLSVEGPLKFNQTDFELKWTEQPNDKYYIQEYLPKDENLKDFNQMLTMHLFDMDVKLKDAVSQKVIELGKRKETDALCNYQVTESPDGKEFIVDFILSENVDDELAIVEFNIYHYRQIELGKKHKAIAVYAYTKRSYRSDISNFFKRLKDDRNSHLKEMTSIEKPKIILKKKS